MMLSRCKVLKAWQPEVALGKSVIYGFGSSMLEDAISIPCESASNLLDFTTGIMFLLGGDIPLRLRVQVEGE